MSSTTPAFANAVSVNSEIMTSIRHIERRAGTSCADLVPAHLRISLAVGGGRSSSHINIATEQQLRRQ